MAIEIIPDWMANLDDEDVNFYSKVHSGLRFPEGDRLPVPCDLSYSPAEAG